jgi:hypothetical protein
MILPGHDHKPRHKDAHEDGREALRGFVAALPASLVLVGAVVLALAALG